MRPRAASVARRSARRSGRHHGAVNNPSSSRNPGAFRFARCRQAGRNPANSDFCRGTCSAMKINAIDLKPGNVLEHQNKLWLVLKRELVQPGKGGAFAQIEIRDLRSGNKATERFRTQETVERVRLDEKEMQFLYMEGDQATFMDNDTFEQVTVPRDLIGDPADFLQDGMVCKVMTYEGT